MWAEYWDTGSCVRKVIKKEKDKVCFEICFDFAIHFYKLYDCNLWCHHHLMILIYIFQIEKIFAGYIGSNNDTMILQDFFRTLPVIIENRVVQTEWSLVINLSNQIFKVVF